MRYVNCNAINGLPNPQYTTDVGSGYLQNKNGMYFKGTSGDLLFDQNKKAYIVLANPKRSNISIVVEDIYASNFSSVPYRLNVYFYAKITGEMVETKDVVIANSNYPCVRGLGTLSYGYDLELSAGKKVASVVVPAFNNDSVNIGGSSIVGPNTLHVLELEPLASHIQVNAAVSYGWWEEPLDWYS